MSSVVPQEIDAEPVNLLSLDGGGIRELSELLILDEIMKRLRHDLKLEELPRPCDYFQLIGGTSTGGLIALLLGRFRMTTDEALKEYSKLAEGIFSETKWFNQDGRYKAKNLESAVKAIVKDKGLNGDPDERMIVTPRQDGQLMSRVFVCAVPSINMDHPRRFRTYEVRSNSSPNCKIWEAARATSAAPTFFKGIKIAEPGHTAETFVDAAVKCNNPTREVINEVREVFGADRYVSCILSIGTDHPGTIGFSKPSLFQRVLPTNLINVLKRLATDCENVARGVESDFQNIPGLYFRFSVQHGTAGISLEEWKKMEELKSHTLSYLRSNDAYVDSVVKVLASWKLGTPTSTHEKITLSQISGKVIPPPKQEVHVSKFKSRPASSSLFTGRDEYLDKLKENFAPRAPESKGRRAMLLCGMGGAGKTQICLKFVEECEDFFSQIFWIDASSRETIQQSFKEIALTESLLEANAEVERAVDTVKGWLGSTRTEWLLIFDNADDGSDIFDAFIPPGRGGNIIFTSRNDGLQRLTGNSCLRVGEMEEEEAISLLLKAAGINDPSPSDNALAKPIVEALFRFALAIDQAGAYISNMYNLGDYLELYTKRRKELLEYHGFKGSSGYGHAVYTTWELSVQAIQRAANASDLQKAEDSSKALTILNVSGFLHHEDIPEEFFSRTSNAEEQSPYDASVDPNWELQWPLEDIPMQLRRKPDEAWDPLSFKRAIRILVSFSLVKMNGQRNGYNIHPLVHSWIRERLSHTEQLTQLKAAVILVACSIDLSSDDWKFHISAFSHVDNCGKLRQERSLKWHLKTAQRFSTVYRENGRFEEAEELERLVIDTGKRILGVGHPDTLVSMSNLAMVYLDQGRYGEAEELEKLVMDTGKRVLGVEHPDTLKSMGNLAAVYLDQGRYGEAEELEKLVMDTRKRVLGVEHPDTLMSMSNLAQTYTQQGCLVKAEELKEAVRKMQIEMLPGI